MFPRQVKYMTIIKPQCTQRALSTKSLKLSNYLCSHNKIRHSLQLHTTKPFQYTIHNQKWPLSSLAYNTSSVQYMFFQSRNYTYMQNKSQHSLQYNTIKTNPFEVTPVNRRWYSDSPAYDTSTVQSVIEYYGNKLEEADIPEPLLSVQHIVSHVLQTSRASLSELSDESLSEEQLEEIERMITCRLERVPVQYILGNWDFHNINLILRPPVFIPRPETEELVEIVLDKISSIEDPKVLEVGCGSGAISLAMLNMNDQLECTAIEQSQQAITLTIENAENLGLIDRLNLIHGKVGSEDIELPDEQFDIIVSNPPYVLRKDLVDLAPEISLYEDLRALDGGKDGLDVIQNILLTLNHLLKPDGYFIFEMDPCHQYLIPQFLDRSELNIIVEDIIDDLNEKQRFIILKKTEE